jgi:hypothetical protein
MEYGGKRLGTCGEKGDDASTSLPRQTMQGMTYKPLCDHRNTTLSAPAWRMQYELHMMGCLVPSAILLLSELMNAFRHLACPTLYTKPSQCGVKTGVV